MSREAIARVRHDLGKYVVFEVSWLGDSLDATALQAALQSDLLATHRSAAGVRSAPELWLALRQELGEAAFDAEAEAIDRAMHELAGLLPVLADDAPPVEALVRLSSLAEQIRRSCYAWWERTRGS